MTRTVTATEAKAQILALLEDVATGDEIQITKHGRVIARLVGAGGPIAAQRRARRRRGHRRSGRRPVRDRHGVGPVVTTLLVDTHALHWWTSEPDRLSSAATAAIEAADEMAVADVTWYELAWLATHGRIHLAVPLRSWLERLGVLVRSVAASPTIAATAAELPESFPGDPADRLIYATAVEHGWQLVTKDRRLRDHPHPRPITLW